ncbi:MAG: F0F1 ATP synthase subunit A [Candidatus Competibacterales bacterium]|nr:F0F1 ATP synthase subunit A [Candidatus Competibacterales bacterium]
MTLSPDEVVFWQWGVVKLNATLVYTWLVMALLVFGARRVTRRLDSGPRLSRWQNALEVIVGGIRDQIRAVSREQAEACLPFVGTLFLFIATANLLTVVPGYEAPTGSLSTTAALALCVFIAVPLYAIRRRGLLGYLREYLEPTVFMLPFNIIGEFTRTLALAVRLYGNVMSGAAIGAILLLVAPLLFPVVMQLLELLLGLIQAYIFSVLALVYIASASVSHETLDPEQPAHG